MCRRSTACWTKVRSDDVGDDHVHGIFNFMAVFVVELLGFFNFIGDTFVENTVLGHPCSRGNFNLINDTFVGNTMLGHSRPRMSCKSLWIYIEGGVIVKSDESVD